MVDGGVLGGANDAKGVLAFGSKFVPHYIFYNLEAWKGRQWIYVSKMISLLFEVDIMMILMMANIKDRRRKNGQSKTIRRDSNNSKDRWLSMSNQVKGLKLEDISIQLGKNYISSK